LGRPLRLSVHASHEMGRYRSNMAHIRQSRPDCGLGFQVKAPKTLQVVPSSLGSGRQGVSLSFQQVMDSYMLWLHLVRWVRQQVMDIYRVGHDLVPS